MKRFLFVLMVLNFMKGNSQNDNQLSYNAFLMNVLQNNPLAKRAENERKYADTRYRAARGNYDPIVSGSFDQKQLNGSNYYTILNGEIKQPIFTSQYFKFGYDYGNGDYINPQYSTVSNGLPYAGVEVGVLQGLLIDKRRAEVLKSREYLNYYDAEKRIQLNALLFEASQRYFDWLFSLKQVALNNYFMQVAKQRLQGIETLAISGEKASVDTIEAAIFYQARYLDLQAAIIDNQKNTNEIYSFNWQTNGPALITENYSTTDSLDLYFNKAKSLLAESLYQHVPSNPILSKYNSLQKVLEIDNRLKKEMIKPVLNVKYNFLSSNAPLISQSFSYNNYKLGLNVSFPLLLRNPVNDYKLSKIVSQNNTLELLNKTNELSFKLNALKKTINILAEQLQSAERSAKYSKMLVEAEKIKFMNGEGTLFMLNTRENKWLESEIKLAEYKLKFIKTILNLIYLNGNLNYDL
ncbi:MAG: TolC family protein [Bacteroidetes bacterium]|nr:TolC family protein [Bacteroidota bacterium]